LSQPDTEIYAYLYRNIFWAVLMTFSICIVAVFFGWSWIRRFLVPIQTLHRQVQVIGQGDLDQKVTIETEDEIGDLGNAFNEMTDSLKEYIAREVETARTLVHTKNLALLGTASSKVTHEVGNFLNNTYMALSGLKREPLSQRGEKIFEPFFTTTGNKGTGLGMPIVKSNTEAHGGSIEYSSKLGKGTIFVIWLPFRYPFE